MKRTVKPPIEAALAANSLTRLFDSEIMRLIVLTMIVSIANSMVLHSNMSAFRQAQV